MPSTLLKKDASNRSVRTFIQGLGIDVAVGVALVLATFFIDKNSWGEVEWTILSFSLAKSAVQALAAYIMRMWLDRSSIPTPLPPQPVAEPNENVNPGELGVGEARLLLLIGLVVFVAAILAWLVVPAL